MTKSAWNPSTYDAAQDYRAATGSAFAYDRTMASTPIDQREVHPDLDPKWRNAAGLKIRECRYSVKFPKATGIVVAFDETGSMGDGPRVAQTKLGKLNGVLLRQAYVPDPQIMFAAIGDAQNDEVAPLQVGQFESDIKMDAQLDNIYLEGLGGGNRGETYGLLLYFLARHTSTDCWEKDRRKGHVLLVGDECPLPLVTRAEVERYIGDTIEADIPVEVLVAEVQERYHLHFLHVNTGAARLQGSLAAWQRLIGQDNVIELESLETISETAAMVIGLTEGTLDSVDEGAEHLRSEGADPAAVAAASQAVVPLARRRGTVATATGHLPASTDPGTRRSRRI